MAKLHPIGVGLFIGFFLLISILVMGLIFSVWASMTVGGMASAYAAYGMYNMMPSGGAILSSGILGTLIMAVIGFAMGFIFGALAAVVLNKTGVEFTQ